MISVAGGALQFLAEPCKSQSQNWSFCGQAIAKTQCQENNNVVKDSTEKILTENTVSFWELC